MSLKESEEEDVVEGDGVSDATRPVSRHKPL